MAPVLVERPEGVTPDWLTAVLRGAGRVRDAEVVGFTTEPVGTGQMGDSVRYRLEWSAPEPDAPDSVVVKFASADERSRATGIAMRTYEVEVRFYQQLAHRVHARTPRCDYADVDTATGACTLVLEDLAPAEQGDQITGCSPDQAAIALLELAKLHAPLWDDAELESLPWLHRTSLDSVEIGAQLLPVLFTGFVERYGDRLDDDVLTLGERFAPRVRDYLAAQHRPWTVQHGDYRLDNLLFGTAAGGDPLAVVDWQTVVHGPGLADVSYFLGAGLRPEARRSHEHDLVREYHAALRGLGVDGYDWATCWADYRRYAFSGLLMAVGASMMVEQTDRGDEMFLTMAERHARHALDLDAEVLLPRPSG